MMLPLSIVILTKNEEQNIVRCLQSVKELSDDILVIDSGSIDATIQLAKSNNAKVINTQWLGYSATKNFGNQLAKNKWILSLDADEELNESMRTHIRKIFSSTISESTAFSLQRKMVYAGKVLHHGSVSNEFRTRLFNKENARWNQTLVHEDIEFLCEVELRTLEGFVWHHSFSSKEDHLARLEKYAQLSATQMHHQGKRATFVKRFLSPSFGFVKNFIFKLGFLDGSAGLQFAQHEKWYVKRKYELLHSLSYYQQFLGKS